MFPTEPKEPVTVDPKFMIIVARPKGGKTELLSQLPGNLMIDMEDGSDFVGGMAIKITSYEQLVTMMQQMKAQGVTYPYISLETAMPLEELVKPLATTLYQDTSMGKNFGLPRKEGNPNKAVDYENGTVPKDQNDILKLPNGAGYLYLRKAFIKVLDAFKPFATKCLILSAHVKDSTININGVELSEMSIALTGQLATIVSSKADAIGFLHRKGTETYLNFSGGGDSIIEARPKHLSGQDILVLEQDKETKEFTHHWDKIFLELNK